LHQRHKEAFDGFISAFEQAGYNLSWQLLNAHDYGVPETRKRIIIVGYRKDLNRFFSFPLPCANRLNLRDAIGDLPEARAALPGNKANSNLSIANHEYAIGGFSAIYMSRNRVRAWDEPSFTIQAGGRHAPIYPRAPKMLLAGLNKRIFAPGHEAKYRRLSIRECARIQTFPDDFIFKYNNVLDGYKMIGNAVPVQLAYILAKQIMKDVRAGEDSV